MISTESSPVKDLGPRYRSNMTSSIFCSPSTIEAYKRVFSFILEISLLQHLLTTSKASSPDRRMMAKADLIGAVAKATIVLNIGLIYKKHPLGCNLFNVNDLHLPIRPFTNRFGANICHVI